MPITYKYNWGGKSFCSILGLKKFEFFFGRSFLSSILFEEYTSSERSKEIHVHVGGKESEKILTYIKIKHGDA